jgi:hypothetical protein
MNSNFEKLFLKEGEEGCRYITIRNERESERERESEIVDILLYIK